MKWKLVIVFTLCIIGWEDGYYEKLSYMETAAHEFGHDVLTNTGGIDYSWRHEGTSEGFLGSRISGSAPPYPATGPINLMRYYNGGSHSYSR